MFENADGPALKRQKIDRVKQQIAAMPLEMIALESSDASIIEALVDEHHVQVPDLDLENAEVSHATGALEVSDYGSRKTVQGETYKFDVPFTGDSAVFHMRADAYDSAPPRGQVFEDKLRFELSGARITEDQLEREFKRWRESVQQYLGWHRAMWRDLDDQIRGAAKAALRQRREKLQLTSSTAQNVAGKLGIKLKERPGDPKTFTPPAVRKKVTPPLPAPKADASAPPDPTLERGIYDAIISILRGAGRSIERSASAIRKHEEEVLRDILLIPLNSHFEGHASGEAFNKAGKTDIAIRHEKQNLFIAECKVWGGAKVLTDAIDQLFRYLTWRDSKAAIIIFNRNVGFSDMLKKTLDTARAHPGFSKLAKTLDDSTWEIEFKYPTDAARVITVTVLVFDMGPGD